MSEHNPFSAPTPSEEPCIEHILYWVWEREAIRIAKENGYQEELTKDPILKQYRFCNVRRKDDRVSRWLINNVYSKPYTDLWFVAAICRYVNWPPMLAILLEHGLIPDRVENFDHVEFGRTIDKVTEFGGKAWSGAYMTFPCKVSAGQPKGAATAQHILAPLKTRADKIRDAIASNHVETTVNSFVGAYGWQVFMAGQVVADLTYTDALGYAEGLYSWAPLGPGSQRGLNRLNGRNLSAKWGQDDFNAALTDINNCLSVELKIEPLTLHDAQNVMCEMDKYWRVLYNEGRPRATYKPETAF